MNILKNHGDSFFDVNGMKLDKYQKSIIKDDSNALLVVAGAGSGKTLTIVGKIKYLIEELGYKKEEILCLSFTNETVNSLKSKINYQVDVFTFHKLALNIIKEHNIKYKICKDSLLPYVVDEYFYSLSISYQKLLMEYFNNDDYKEILKDKRFNILKFNIISFIRKIKANNLCLKDLKLLKVKCHNKKNKIFLLFAFQILEMYLEELSSVLQIDFDDMIINATELVKKDGIKRKYKYIIVDEYQDISLIRFKLIYEIIKYCNAKIMCVGDDYQSIYGFSGSNLDLFIHFFKYFKDGKRMDIKNTYRNSYELVHIALKFIQKNPYQLRKNIHATFFNKHPIVLVYYDNDYIKTYNNLLNYLYLENKKNILVLSRYNKDLDEIKKIENNVMNLSFLTVHKAKGLESDNVILIKMENSYLGFPSKIENNSVFSLIEATTEEFDYAEERRLFYVALTRCKEKIYLLVPKNNPSIFVEEIKNQCVELLLK